MEVVYISVYYPFLVNYNKVCGQVRGYQYGSPDGAGPNLGNGIKLNTEIDQIYVDGVSITYDENPHKHIWTYMGSAFEQTSNIRPYVCPSHTKYNQ